MIQYINENLNNLSTPLNNKSDSDIKDYLLQSLQKINFVDKLCDDLNDVLDYIMVYLIDRNIFLTIEAEKRIKNNTNNYLLTMVSLKYLNGEGDDTKEFMFGIKINVDDGNTCNVELLFY